MTWEIKKIDYFANRGLPIMQRFEEMGSFRRLTFSYDHEKRPLQRPRSANIGARMRQ